MKSNKWAIGLMVLLLLAALGTVLVACGEETTTTTAAPVTTAPSETTEPPATTETTAAPTTTSEEALKPVDLKFAYHTPVKASLVEAYFVPWTEAITAASDGQITITHYGGESLVKEAQQLDALLSGTADIALIEPEFNAGVFKRAEVGNLPGLFPNAVVASEVYWDILEEYCQEELTDFHLLGVAILSGGPYFGNKEVKVPGDLKGLRMRTGGKLETWFIEATGGTPVEISLGETATQFERKAVDGTFLSWTMLLSQGLKDVTKYRTNMEMFYRCWMIGMNKDTWEALPQAYKDIFTKESGRDNSAKYNGANEQKNVGARKAVEGSDKGAGNPPVFEPNEEQRAEWFASGAPVWDKWVKNLGADQPGQEMIDRILELVAKSK